MITSILPMLSWLTLFCGWLSYWLKKLSDTADHNKANVANLPFKERWKSHIICYIDQNNAEIPNSLIACFVLAVGGKSIPASQLDLTGPVCAFLAGYFSSSVLNSIITKGKLWFPMLNNFLNKK